MFDKRLYSVPWRLMGKSVWVRANARTVDVYADDDRIASHSRRGADKRSTLEEHIPEGRRDLRHRTREYWVDKAEALGPEVRAFIEEVFDSDDVLYQLRTVQAIMGLLAKYPPHRVKATAMRASFYGVTSYVGVKRILVNALDLEWTGSSITLTSSPSRVTAIETPRPTRGTAPSARRRKRLEHDCR